MSALGLSPEDTELLNELGDLLVLADPVPSDLVARIQFALELENPEFIEIATRAHTAELAGVRSQAGPSTMTFTVEDLTVMVSIAPAAGGHRFDGWLVPSGPHTVEVRVDGHDSQTTAADDGGRFVLTNVPLGCTQLLVHLAVPEGQRPRTVVTPTIMR
ncbi:MAG TPA: carboxypeptidase regulatory-like domain-containing protein [Pseudonocardiaceae bacterium]